MGTFLHKGHPIVEIGEVHRTFLGMDVLRLVLLRENEYFWCQISSLVFRIPYASLCHMPSMEATTVRGLLRMSIWGRVMAFVLGILGCI